MMNTKGFRLAAAVAGLLMTSPLVAIAGEGKAAKVMCEGANSCKGKSGCKSARNACAGKNGCAGKGWVAVTEEECKAKGGKIVGKVEDGSAKKK
jgi:hypothetical protein